MTQDIALQVTGLQQLINQWRGAKGVKPEVLVRATIRDALIDETQPILNDMKVFVPKDTGALRRSLGRRTKTYDGGRLILTVLGPRRGQNWAKGILRRGNSGQFHQPRSRNRHGELPSRYAHLVEFGTSRTAAHPFIRPAWDIHKAGFRDRLLARIDAGLRRHRFIP